MTLNQNNKTFLLLNKILTIFMIVSIGFTFIGIWAPVSEIYADTYRMDIDISYYVFDGWKYLFETGASITSFICLGVSAACFIAALIIVYYFGIKGIIKGIKNFAGDNTKIIYKEFFIVAIATYIYFTVAKVCNATFLGGFNNANYYRIYSYDGIGTIACGLVIWPVVLMMAAYLCAVSFDKNNIAGFVIKIFYFISAFLCFGIVNQNCDGLFGNGLFSTLKIATNAQNVQPVISGFYIFEFVLSLAVIAMTVAMLIKMGLSILSDNKQDPKIMLIFAIILAALGFIVIVTNGPVDSLLANSEQTIHGQATLTFVYSIIILTANIANYIVETKEESSTVEQ